MKLSRVLELPLSLLSSPPQAETTDSITAARRTIFIFFFAIYLVFIFLVIYFVVWDILSIFAAEK